MNKRDRNNDELFALIYLRVGQYWEAVGPSVSVRVQSHVMIKSLSGVVSVVDGYLQIGYSSAQHAPCCRLKQKAKRIKERIKDDKRGGLWWGIHLVKLGQGARNVWAKPTIFLGVTLTVDVVFVVLSVCCLVKLSPSLFTVQFLNRWRPVSWWSWEEVEGGSCWAEEVECAVKRQIRDAEI